MALYLASCALSYIISLKKGAINVTPILMYSKAITVIIPFHAFIAVFLYNEKNFGKVVRLTFLGLSILVFINLFGFFILGIENAVHSIEGRVNFPFMDGLYSGASLLAILCLMILYYLRRSLDDPFRFIYLLAYFLLNIVILYLINSRMTNMIFIVVIMLFLFKISNRPRLLFVASVFTLPILLNAGFLIYRIVSLPVFTFIMRRVNLVDVMTFNGRSAAWQRVMDWMFYDQRGLVFGNGANGHYFLHLIRDIAQLWGVQESGTHLHSTVLMVLVDQGLLGYGLLTFLFYHLCMFYRKQSLINREEGVFYAGAVFMFIVMQVDIFVLIINFGGLLFSFMMARVVMREEKGITAPSFGQ
jgi:hypothetical protein